MGSTPSWPTVEREAQTNKKLPSELKEEVKEYIVKKILKKDS